MYILWTTLAVLLLAPNYISCQEGEAGSRNTATDKSGQYQKRMGDVQFGYYADNGPETWGAAFPQCNGRFQSPIDINTNNFEFRQMRKALKWTNMEKIPDYVRAEKTENSLGMTASWRNKRDRPSISGGPLTERYYFYHLHFHWNTSSDAGSEHTVNGRRYPMEVHVVYTTNPEGTPTDEHKTLVTGFMVNLSARDHPGFRNIIEGTRRLANDVENEVVLPPFPLKALQLDFCEDYVIYSGSLTTPPCTGGITWIISSRPLQLSARQYNTLKNTVSIPGRPVSANARPTQRVNGRKVFYIVSPGCRGSIIPRDVY